jgi:hypothetical protein
MTQRFSLKMSARAGIETLVMLATALVVTAVAGPPPPPGGHIPVHFGGANQGGYPQSTTAVNETGMAAAPSLAMVTSSPNPFRGATLFRFNLAQGEEARLRVFSLAGRGVREIVHRASAAGVQSVAWDGRDGAGRMLAAGVYFYQVTAGERSVTKKLVLLR